MEADVSRCIERMRQGDSTALGEFIARHRLQLLAYIERRLGPALRAKIETDDILQEASVAAMQRIKELSSADREPFGWLCQIAEQRLVDAHRRLFSAQKRAAERETPLSAPAGVGDRSPLIDLLVASMTTPSQAFSRDQNEILLHEALASLPEESREALRLRYVDGLASKEIADRMRKTDAAVRVLLSRSLARLQAAFAGSPPR